MAKKIDQRDHRIVGYLVLQAKMVNRSPLRIASGRSNRAEVEVIRLPDGSPYIPAAGMVGALYHRYRKEINDGDPTTAEDVLWGTPMTKATADRTDTWQSHLRVADMRLDLPKDRQARVVVRDGVRIEHKTNTAADGAKFDYEVLERGHEFTFTAEVTLREAFRAEFGQLKQILGYIGETLEANFQIGGLTTRGMGLLERKSLAMRHFDFGKEGQAEEWFDYLKKGEKLSFGDPIDGLTSLPRKKVDSFSIVATFGLKSSLIIGAAAGPDDDSDKVSLRSDGKPVISGTSLAGAIRHRSLKILNTLGCADSEELINDLYGTVDQKGKARPKKSRVTTHESEITGVQKKVQTRIRIDRFTGGVIRGGLFDSEPVWRTGKSGVKLKIDLREPEPWEPALLLHVLKDLWTADLAIGGEKNVGRGLLEGKEATIRFGDEVLTLKAKGENGIELRGSDEAKAKLAEAENTFVERFKIPQPE